MEDGRKTSSREGGWKMQIQKVDKIALPRVKWKKDYTERESVREAGKK